MSTWTWARLLDGSWGARLQCSIDHPRPRLKELITIEDFQGRPSFRRVGKVVECVFNKKQGTKTYFVSLSPMEVLNRDLKYTR